MAIRFKSSGVSNLIPHVAGLSPKNMFGNKAPPQMVPSWNLNIGETGFWRLDFLGQIYKPVIPSQLVGLCVLQYVFPS